MINPWMVLFAGMVFCVSGIFFFFRNIFEEGRSVKWAVIVMAMGVVLISLASFRLLEENGHV
ncbi:MAG: hypothetical protein DI535_01170 [Citrobacter freundii]|nr:MAG: hypothetical protein DI535_01170 [Citrobacter freundii]